MNWPGTPTSMRSTPECCRAIFWEASWAFFPNCFRRNASLRSGPYTGYSAICLARGLRKGGTLTTIEVNVELREISLSFFSKAGLEKQIELINGDALQIIPSLKESFDLVFVDGNKDDYPAYYDLVIDRVTPGGYILVDNVLWGGKVLDSPPADDTTRIMHQFNLKVGKDQRVENLLLPLRDGLMVIKKT
jgi:caffeoyl-CoA O-methyltransferase